MNTAYLLTGANVGDREESLARAISLLDPALGQIAATSPIYETEPWGNSDQPSFLNQALELKTNVNARQLMRRILKVEKSMGRVREEKYGPRTIDIDILFFNDERHNYHFLKLPHPELQNRRFALLPLHEIAPDYRHPVLNKTISELLENCPDTLLVKKYS